MTAPTLPASWTLRPLGAHDIDSLLHVQTEVDLKTGVLLARNFYNTEFPDRIVFVDVNDAARTVTGRDIPVVYGERRPGDPARLVADSRRARAELGWEPRYADLAAMVGHAWQWETRRQQ